MSEFAGSLGERIRIERPIGDRNPMGIQESDWEELCDCLAAVTAEGAGPEGEAMALSAMPRFRVTIRSRDGVAIDQRIRWRDRLLAIRQILNDPRLRDRIVFRCEEMRQ